MVDARHPVPKRSVPSTRSLGPPTASGVVRSLLLVALALGPRSAAADALFTPAGTLAGAALVELAQLPAAPTAITHAGDDRLFLALRPGAIRILANGRLLPAPYLDLSALVGQDGEGGLLAIAFHPRYADNGFVFVSYTDRAGDSVIARYRRSASDANRADPASATILLTVEQPFSNHNGGQIHFGPDGDLYIGLGDGGAAGDPGCRAQRADTLLGKLLRIDVDRADPGLAYAIPPDNPFRGADPRPDEAWAVGLRNPWRFSFDRATGDLWLGDVGQGEREEVDFEPAGAPGGRNYGWNPMEGSLCFGGGSCPTGTPACGAPELTPPVLEYEHTDGRCSITGGFVYRGIDFPTLSGRYFFGDFCGGQVFSAAPAGADFDVRRLARDTGGLITFGQDRRGELYAGTLDGRLLRLARGEGVAELQEGAARFLLRHGPAAGPIDRRVQLGSPAGDLLPIAGDWDGDGRTGIGVYDRTTGRFLLQNRAGSGQAVLSFALGPAGSRWLPISGDWDGDGTDGVGLYDPATGIFRLRQHASAGAFDATFRFGPTGRAWLPIAGDWNGDGTDGIGLYDPATATFRLRQRANAGPVEIRTTFGPARRRPLAGDWDGDGRDGLGVFDPATGRFQLRQVVAAGAADLDFTFGGSRADAQPVSGVW